MWANLTNLNFSCRHRWGWTARGVGAFWLSLSNKNRRQCWWRSMGANTRPCSMDTAGACAAPASWRRCRSFRLFWGRLGDRRLHTAAISLRLFWRIATGERHCLRSWSHLLFPLDGSQGSRPLSPRAAIGALVREVWNPGYLDGRYVQSCPSQPKTSYIRESLSNRTTNCRIDLCFPAPTNGRATGVIGQTGTEFYSHATHISSTLVSQRTWRWKL